MAQKVVKKTEKTEKLTRTQVKHALKNGNPINTERQFGKPGGNKQGRGFWKKEDTPRFKLEQMMKLSEPELKGIVEDTTRPYFERKLAICIHKGEWKEIESMIDQVYGRPIQRFEGEVEVPTPLVDLTKRKKK